MKRFPWLAALIGLLFSVLLLAVPLSTASGQPEDPAWLINSPTRWPTVTRGSTDTRWPSATAGPSGTRRGTPTRTPSPTRWPTVTRWPTIARRPSDTRWPSPTVRPTATRWPTVTRGPTVTHALPTSIQPTPSWTPTPLPTFTPTVSSVSPADWLRYSNSLYGLEFYYPADARLTAQDDSHVEMFFTVTPGTNLGEKYLELYISNASAGCPASFAGTVAGAAFFNGFGFQVGTGADAGAGQLHEFTTYSTQQSGVCFAMTFILHSGNLGAMPTGTPPFDKAAESALFTQIMNTFRLPTPTAVPTAIPTLTNTSNATATRTGTNTRTPTITRTPTRTPWPTNTARPTATPTPTFDFPKVTIKVGVGSCRFGPSVAYMHAEDVLLGDTGVVWGRAANSTWLYVKMDKWTVPCWVAPSLVTVDGNILRVGIQPVRLPITNALYGPPQNVRAVRQGGQVVVTWDLVWRTQDDDRGYFLDVFVCQNGVFAWVPVGLDTQYTTSYTFTDGPGCSLASGGQIYTVEKHGYTSPVNIPWPAP